MKSLWNDAEAAQFGGPLGPRVYTSRLLGRDKSLVLHGGGNTSVKIEESNLFGETAQVLYVKGSGWDLETIEPAGFAPVQLDYVRRLASLPTLSDPQMVNELATHTLRADAPAPSVEAILHALLPHRYVDHTHADAVLSVSNSPDGDKRVRDIYGDRVVVIPYVMPGFDLAAYCAREYPKQKTKNTVGMVLLSHGVFSFAAEARESYELMIELVSLAEKYLAAKKAWSVGLPPAAAGPFRREEAARLRSEVSKAAGFPLLCRCNDAPQLLGFARHPDVARISQGGPATPDHVIRTKPVPMLGRNVEGFASSYRNYFEQNSKTAKEPKTMLDPAPRMALDPEFGLRVLRAQREGRRHHRGPLRAHGRRHPARRGAGRLAGAARPGHLRRRILGPGAGQAEEGGQPARVRRRNRRGHRRRLRHRQGLRRGVPEARRGGGRPGPESGDRGNVEESGFSGVDL